MRIELQKDGTYLYGAKSAKYSKDNDLALAVQPTQFNVAMTIKCGNDY